MTFVSYAQNFEDVMLRRALSDVGEGFYIDVGAQSPDLDSVTRAFSDAGWRGINVEPHPAYHADLVERRPRDINLQCALGEAPGTATIHLVGRTGLSTLDSSIAGRHGDAGLEIVQVDVQVETLDSIWERHVPSDQAVHFLKVDVEGFEFQVLRGNDWTRHRPWVVVVEATAPNSTLESYADWEPCLIGASYEFVYADGLNRYYLAHEHAGLASAFRYPPNVFDNFIMASLESARQEATRLKSSLDSNVDQVGQLKLSLQAARDEALQFAQQRDQLDANLTAQEERLVEMERRMSETSETLVRTQALLEQATEHLAVAEADSRDARREIASLSSDLASIYASTSWRLTAPVRVLGRYVRRPARNGSER